MRKPASILIAAVVIAAGVVIGRSPASAHPGHSITVGNATTNEGGTASFTLTVTPAPETGETVSVDVATANGTAASTTSCPSGSGSASADYVRVTTTKLTWSAGESTKQQNVTTCQDTTGEGNETFFLNLSGATTTCVAPCAASSATIGDFQGIGTINDDEDVPSLQIGNRTMPEGSIGTTTFAFPVTISAPTSSDVTVTASTRIGTATSSDFTPRTTTVTFPANTTAPRNVNITVAGDTNAEPDETFFVDLSQPVNAKIADPEGIGIIQNDDLGGSGTNTFTITDVSRAEGNGGTTPATPFTFTVTLGQPPSLGRTASVNFHTAETTASSGTDFLFTNGTLSFDAGETAKTVTVAVIGDAVAEPNETFSVILSGSDCSPSCAAPSIADAEGKGTITNDDQAPTPTPTPTPTATPTASPGGGSSVTPKLKVGGYFQARVTAASPCQAGRLIKIKKVVSGTDKVMVDGRTDATGVYKEAVRPKKSGQFYAQVYTFTKNGVTCRGGKSPVRTLPA